MIDNDNRRLRSLNVWLHMLGVLPLLVGGAAYYGAVAAPLHAQREAAAKRAATLEKFLEKGADVAREYDQVSTLIKETRLRADVVRRQIPEEPREADFMRDVTTVADDEGVVIRDYTHGAVTKSSTYSQMDVQINCEGGFAQICGFLDRIANSTRAATVTRLQVTSAAESQRYPVQLTLGLYFGLPGGAAAGGKDAEG